MTRTLLGCTVSLAALSIGCAYAQTTLNGGGATIPEPTYASEFTQFSNANPSVLFSYPAAGDPAGQEAFLNNAISHFRNLPAGTPVYGTSIGSQVDFGASDMPLAASQLTDPATGGYANSASDGPLIQLPMIGVGIALAYVNTGLTGALVLTDDQICGILSGKLTNWDQVSPQATPGTIQVVYASGTNGNSGTNFLLTNHLNAVCTSANSSFPVLPVPITERFITLFTKAKPPANFTGESSSAAIQSQLLATPLSFGYLTPDYTSIAPKSATTSSLKVASVVNPSNGKAYPPNTGNIRAGLNKPGAGSTNVTPPATLTDSMNPLNWVPSVPVTTGGYSIVGYTTWEVSSCYADLNAAANLVSFLTVHYRNKTYQTLISNNGFASVSNTAGAPYVNAIVNTFLNNSNGYNLNIGNKTVCAGFPGR